MGIKKYIPRRGDIVWLNFSSTKGHEQSGRRPALVLSPESYNRPSGLAVVVLITKKTKGYPFEVPVSFDVISGAVLADQIRSVAYEERGTQFIAQAPESVIGQVVGKIKSLID